MKKRIAVCFAALASASAIAATVKTATQPWVEAKIASATNAAQTAATASIASATNGLASAASVSASIASATNGLASLASLAPLSSQIDANAANIAANAAALAAHKADTSNPHGVTAEQVGALTEESDPAFAAWTNGAHIAAGYGAFATEANVALGYQTKSYGYASVALGGSAEAHSGVAIGYQAYINCTNARPEVAFSAPIDGFYLGSSTTNAGSTARSLQSYLDERATKDALAAVSNAIPVISATDPAFSNAVLQVGIGTLGITANDLQVVHDLAELPVGTSITTVGGLLAALAAALAALKKSVSTLSAKVDDANAALEEVA